MCRACGCCACGATKFAQSKAVQQAAYGSGAAAEQVQFVRQNGSVGAAARVNRNPTLDCSSVDRVEASLDCPSFSNVEAFAAVDPSPPTVMVPKRYA